MYKPQQCQFSMFWEYYGSFILQYLNTKTDFLSFRQICKGSHQSFHFPETGPLLLKNLNMNQICLIHGNPSTLNVHFFSMYLKGMMENMKNLTHSHQGFEWIKTYWKRKKECEKYSHRWIDTNLYLCYLIPAIGMFFPTLKFNLVFDWEDRFCLVLDNLKKATFREIVYVFQSVPSLHRNEVYYYSKFFPPIQNSSYTRFSYMYAEQM